MVTLKDLFDSKLDLAMGESDVGKTKSLQGVRDRLPKDLSGATWDLLLQQLSAKLGELLSVGLGDVLAGAWNRYRELRKYADRSQYPADKTIVAGLAKHTIRSHHDPYIEVSANRAIIGRIVFSVDLELELRGLELEIRDARIKRILSGSFSGKGTIALEGFTIVETKFPSRSLPGAIDLGPGIALE